MDYMNNQTLTRAMHGKAIVYENVNRLKEYINIYISLKEKLLSNLMEKKRISYPPWVKLKNTVFLVEISRCDPKKGQSCIIFT